MAKKEETISMVDTFSESKRAEEHRQNDNDQCPRGIVSECLIKKCSGLTKILT